MNSSSTDPVFLEVAFQPVPGEWSDILTAELAEIGFDSFNEEENTLLAYITETAFDEKAIHNLIGRYTELKDLFWSVTPMPEQNWNAIWESSYEPVLVAGRCYIRAPFHPPFDAMKQEAPGRREEGRGKQDPGCGYEIIIEPKMSFGTAHHETTSMMIEALLEENLQGQRVLDMGCGTGVLAILAHKMGAGEVEAIDNDPWAFENAKENIMKNNAVSIHVIQGDVDAIPEKPFNLILANINRNILIEQIPEYETVLEEGGRILVSGFYSEDLPVIEACAMKSGLSLSGFMSKNNWVAAKFSR